MDYHFIRFTGWIPLKYGSTTTPSIIAHCQKLRCSGRQNQRPIVPDEWHNHTGRVAVTVDLSDGRVAIIEQNTKQSNYLKLRISHTPDIISESWKLLWREQVISHM